MVQKELGLESISAAQLCRKNYQVNSTLLEQIFAELVARILKEASSTKTRQELLMSSTVDMSITLRLTDTVTQVSSSFLG